MVSCSSVASKKTGSSCAMPVDSLFTSISYVGMFFPVFRNKFSLVPFLTEIINLLWSSFFRECVNGKIKPQYEIAGVS